MRNVPTGLAATSAIACAFMVACSGAAPVKAPTPSGPAVPHVMKPVFDCGGPSAPIVAAAPSSTPAQTSTLASLPATGLVFDPHADRIAHWSERRLVVRSARDGATVWRGAGRGAVMRNDGAQMASFEGGALVVRDLPSGTEVMRAAMANGALGAAWEDDGKRILVVDAPPAAPGTVIYDVAARTSCRGSYSVPVASPTSFAFPLDRAHGVVTWPGAAPDARRNAGILMLVESAPLDPVPMVPTSGKSDFGFVFSRTGIVIAGIGEGVGVYVWDVRTGKHGDAMAGSAGASAVALSDEGAHVAAITNGGTRVRVWESGTAKLVREITPTTPAAIAIAFFPARKRVAISSIADDVDAAEAWDIVTGSATWSAK